MRYLLLFCVLLVGCEQVKNDVVLDDNVAKSISEKMTDFSSADLDLQYKQFSGLAEYVKNSNRVNNTLHIEKLVTDFGKVYNWETKKYADYSKSVDEFLISKDWKKTKKIVNEVKDPSTEKLRSDVVNELMTIANASKIASENKNAK